MKFLLLYFVFGEKRAILKGLSRNLSEMEGKNAMEELRD